MGGMARWVAKSWVGAERILPWSDGRYTPTPPSPIEGEGALRARVLSVYPPALAASSEAARLS